mgnify:CR=1 FL=1
MNLKQMILRQQELLSLARGEHREFTAVEQTEFDNLSRLQKRLKNSHSQEDSLKSIQTVSEHLVLIIRIQEVKIIWE